MIYFTLWLLLGVSFMDAKENCGSDNILAFWIGSLVGTLLWPISLMIGIFRK